jgi:hypothetical protein
MEKKISLFLLFNNYVLKENCIFGVGNDVNYVIPSTPFMFLSLYAIALI